jgi:hypothetical protein
MTTLSRSPKPPAQRREIDVRCSAALPSLSIDRGRCQLFAGHDGPHALMFADRGQRTVRSWSTRDPAGFVDAPGAFQRPWMFGFPMPAWFTEAPDEPGDG